MANDKSTEQKQKEYFYKRCLPRGNKVHIDSYACWKCGKRPEDMVYCSNNPNDYLFNIRLNNVEKCMSCYNVQRGVICKYIICFGTGKGDCDKCRNLTETRFCCCQEVQKQEKELYNKELFRMEVKANER
jgi:hypothetical protein